MPAPLLLAYDPACSLCCRLALWLARQDRHGHLLLLDLRDRQVLALAPELGGLPLEREIHGIDLVSRRVYAGAALLGPVARRLPAWRWAAPLLAIPGCTRLVHRLYLAYAVRRFRRTGRPPFA